MDTRLADAQIHALRSRITKAIARNEANLADLRAQLAAVEALEADQKRHQGETLDPKATKK